MKLNKWLYGAAALAMLAACSDKDVAPGGGESDGTGNGSAASGYLAVQINLPQETSTRAEENDQFDDGTSNEYKVHDARIILFKGDKSTGEKDAKFYRSQTLVKPFFDNLPTEDQITSSYLAAIPVSTTPGTNDNFWALVFINCGNLNINDGSDDVEGGGTINTITIGGTKFNENNKFSDFLNTIIKAEMLNKDNNNSYSEFFMANAPLSTAYGGPANVAGGVDATKLKSDNIKYLTDLGNKVWPTMEQAKNNVSGCIYVERAVSKVTGSLGTNPFKLKFYSGEKDDDGNRIEITDKYEVSADIKYALTNTNNESYIIRNVEFGADSHFKWSLNNNNINKVADYRMVGNQGMPALNTPFHEENKTLYRTYWCKDPNYGTQMNDKKVATAADLVDFDQPLYCRENTFEVQYQNYGNSTLVVFEVDYTIIDKTTKEAVQNLFIKDGNNEVIYLSKEDAAADEISRIVNHPTIKDALEASVKDNAPQEDISDAQKYLDIKIGREVDSEGKTTQNLIIQSVTLKIPEGDNYFDNGSKAKFDAYLNDNNFQNVIDNINLLNEITEYTGGKSYYVKPIKHFGDFYCPWNEKGIETKDAYNEGNSWTQPNEDHAAKYLGRYGMVRNNWYELTISDIKSLGSPTFPTIDVTLSDDNEEDKQYFAVEIHILSWAKRIQNVDF